MVAAKCWDCPYIVAGDTNHITYIISTFESVGNHPSNNLPKVKRFGLLPLRILGHKLSSPGALNDFTEDNLL